MESAISNITADRLLETRHADEVIASLENASTQGLPYVIVELYPSETTLRPSDLSFYEDEEEATEAWEMKTTGGSLPGDAHHPVYFRETEKLLDQVRFANPPPSEHLIAGVLFSYNKELDVFFEKGNPANYIAMAKIWEDQLWSQFFFDHQTKNIYQGDFPDGKRPAHVQLALLPTFPYCEKLGIKIQSYQENAVAQKVKPEQREQVGQRNKSKIKKGRKLS